MSELMISRARKAEREYYEKLKPEKYLEKVMYESIDLDPIPDYLERIDLNPRTTEYRFNYPHEVFVIGREHRQYYPYL